MMGAVGALTSLWKPAFIESFPKGASLLLILITMLIGGLIGIALRLENRLDHFGVYLRDKFKASSESPFVDGFVTASLLFVIGPLAILGSISDGMGSGLDQLILKSSLDFFASLAFASSLGWGVAASVIPVALYQGTWTLIGLGLGTILSDYQVDAMTIVGGLMLVGISLKLLNIKKIAVGNLLPAMFLAPLTAALVHALL
jgi:uncharacterized membrane protein YqgA involved in biofilm formation